MDTAKDVNELVNKQRAYFRTGETLNVKWRITA